MDDAITKIVDFVEGRIEAKEFEQIVYSDPGIEKALGDDPTLEPGWYVGIGTFYFIIQQDFSTPGGILNVQGALEQFLERKKVLFKPSKVHSKFYDLLLSAQPRWLRVPDEWLKKHVLIDAQDRQKKELRDWIRKRLLELFRYRVKPPRWIQSPNWPINDNVPLVFLGQMNISGYFHDEATAYLFHDPKSGICETVIQVY